MEQETFQDRLLEAFDKAVVSDCLVVHTFDGIRFEVEPGRGVGFYWGAVKLSHENEVLGQRLYSSWPNAESRERILTLAWSLYLNFRDTPVKTNPNG